MALAFEAAKLAKPPLFPSDTHRFMRPITLKTVTWATVAAAVASALWLAAVEAERGVDVRLPALAQPAFMLPHAPTRAGPAKAARPEEASQRKSERAASR